MIMMISKLRERDRQAKVRRVLNQIRGQEPVKNQINGQEPVKNQIKGQAPVKNQIKGQ